MSFDALVSSPGRLRILTSLAGEPVQPFVELRRRTGLTDGNLATHARRLESAGLVAIQKSITSGKPLTTLHLTREGRDALTAHAQALLAALDRHASPVPERVDVTLYPGAAAADDDNDDEDDWVD